MGKITAYHGKYFAYELTREYSSDDLQKFTRTLLNAKVDLNPHQVEAALFAFRSPFSKGAILADEVGLGKTIEAGILLSQKWAEKKRHILLVMPSSLRKQWQQELADKFYLPSFILEAGTFNSIRKAGSSNPFDTTERIVICSYHFAKAKAEYIRKVDWDIAVLDEAHRLRNVYKKDNKIANEIKDALAGVPKVLLTATPLQNSLLELYGLVSLIDEQIFGDIESFRSQFSRADEDGLLDLRSRIRPVCQRTLRKQVPDIPYTNRIAITQEFVPTEKEHQLYEHVSNYLQKGDLYALPKSQRHLMTLILRKLLASSSFAISSTLDKLATKLEQYLASGTLLGDFADVLDEDERELYNEHQDEHADEEDVSNAPTYTAEQKQAIEKEIQELRHFHKLAEEIEHNAKGDALIEGLRRGFEALRANSAPDKAVIFTESTRTQNYLFEVLNSIPDYTGKVLLFNGSNNDQLSKRLYDAYQKKYAGTERISGSRSADTRAAIVDAFRDTGMILIATEAAAEGINLQFCSLLVNYDLPWNPQRIEQRIGRCHRYGQKFDVVVINFLNKKNAADQRVYELLNEKFKLFNGVFGASDEVLGAIQSGVDFEKRIVEIYQTCRSEVEIKTAFDALRAELDEQLTSKLTEANKKLFEHFDEEVREKLKVQDANTKQALATQERYLWQLAQLYLSNSAVFEEGEYRLTLHTAPRADVPTGVYHMDYRKNEPHHFRIGCPLAEWLLETAKSADTPNTVLKFAYTGSNTKISTLEPLVGKKGVLSLNLLTVAGADNQELLVFAGQTASGHELDADQCYRLFSLPATTTGAEAVANEQLQKIFEKKQHVIMTDIAERNSKYFNEESMKLEKWADDKKASLEKEMKDTKIRMRELNREARQEKDMQKQLEIQKRLKETERKLRILRQNIFQAEDEIETERERLIATLEEKLKQSTAVTPIFSIEWELV
ncbi:DEAD/DEAH box helicase [Patescibacteria group bacterium]|nr:DEAD/DEAH box helicase [Patescibacteria group bacterium]